MTTKEGIEIKIMTKVEMVWSTHVFFFKPATIPKPIPKGTEIKTAKTLTDIETGKRCPIILIAEAFGSITVDLPQSHFVKMLPIQEKY